MRRSRFFVIAAAFGALMMSATTANATTTVYQTKDVPFYVTVISCNQDEYVDLWGTLHIQYKESLNKSRYSESFKFNVQQAYGEGEWTYDPYTAGGTFSISQSGSLVNGVASFAFRFNGTLTDLYTGLTDYVHINVKGQTNAQGIDTADVENFDSNCIV